jgi:cyclopropane fatty-acyl-phospholipid synthase-like methyltransferase
MNVNNSKKILSYLRNGDFAHPGEIEAIELTMKSIVKNPNQYLLDIGCGLGGTAYYLQKHGWGKVVGLDIDSEVIIHAKQLYPDVPFINCDVIQAQDFLQNKKFNVIYFFTSFFCFQLQQECLLRLTQSAEKNCELVIFDYSRLQQHAIPNPFHHSKTSTQFNPIYLKEFKEMLENTGWSYKTSIDISAQFKQWYIQLLHQFNNKRNELIKQFDLELCDAMYDGYVRLLDEMEKKNIGGIIVYATRQSEQ